MDDRGRRRRRLRFTLPAWCRARALFGIIIGSAIAFGFLALRLVWELVPGAFNQALTVLISALVVATPPLWISAVKDDRATHAAALTLRSIYFGYRTWIEASRSSHTWAELHIPTSAAEEPLREIAKVLRAWSSWAAISSAQRDVQMLLIAAKQGPPHQSAELVDATLETLSVARELLVKIDRMETDRSDEEFKGPRRPTDW